MALTAVCQLCGSSWSGNPNATQLGNVVFMDCQRCGTFGALSTVYSDLNVQSASLRRSIIRWIGERSSVDPSNTPIITREVLEAAKRQIAPTVTQMADALLRYCVRRSTEIGQVFELTEIGLVRAVQALTWYELRPIADYLEELNLLKFHGETSSFEITARGYIQAEAGAFKSGDSVQAFVAMWFSDSLNEAFTEGLCKAIRSSGYLPFRIDTKEHANKIDDEIVAEIRKSRFLVADFTGHRGGVYFEAGFAQGIGIPVIWTCKHDAMAGLHFDIRQYNCIDWQHPADLADRLAKRITALIGQGPIQTT